MLTGFAAGAEREDSSKVGSVVRDTSEEGSVEGDLSEMGLTDSAEGEGILGKRFGRGLARESSLPIENEGKE